MSPIDSSGGDGAPMAELFVGDLAEVRRAFVGWRRPITIASEAAVENPFTGELERGKRRVPDPADHEVPPTLPGASLDERRRAFGGASFAELDPMKLAYLALFLVGGRYDALFDRLTTPVLVGPSEGDGLLVELPADLVTAIAGAEEPAIRRAAARWSEALLTGLGEGWPEAECAGVIRSLRGLAQRAARTRRALYYLVVVPE
jgi:hypothetical protein